MGCATDMYVHARMQWPGGIDGNEEDGGGRCSGDGRTQKNIIEVLKYPKTRLLASATAAKTTGRIPPTFSPPT